MPILAELSRRLHLLTTDAKPDPPRIHINDNTNNLGPRLSPKSAPPTPEVERTDESKRDRRSSMPEGSSDSEKDRRSSPETKKTRYKTKSHSMKNGQTANIVNYNIVNSSGVKIGGTTTYVCNVNQYPGSPPKEPSSPGRTSPKPKCAPMPEEVESLWRENSPLTLEDMFVIKTHLGRGWKDVFKGLGYSEGQLQQFEEHHKDKGLDEVIYQTLLDWKQSSGSEARLGVLIKALWRCQQYDCARRLVQSHKNL
ncbi:protein immune deficiency [Diachasma alloeum]|uniref:protein immune deficiency n=1 Tax=Diachasma alloeum TaxID=454923 RepID=UPI0007383EAF|nr:protein immune deficiency [Diachasma alloeum]